MKTMKLYKVSYKDEMFDVTDEAMVLAPDADYAVKVCLDATGIYGPFPLFDVQPDELTVEEICGTDAEQPRRLLISYNDD